MAHERLMPQLLDKVIRPASASRFSSSALLHVLYISQDKCEESKFTCLLHISSAFALLT